MVAEHSVIAITGIDTDIGKTVAEIFAVPMAAGESFLKLL